jgi:hypothetical protein
MGTSLDMRPDTRRPVAVGVACDRLRLPHREGIIHGRETEALQVDETFEDRPRRNPCTGGDLGGGRDLGLLAQQLDIGFHDQLLGALAAQAPTVKRR